MAKTLKRAGRTDPGKEREREIGAGEISESVSTHR